VGWSLDWSLMEGGVGGYVFSPFVFVFALFAGFWIELVWEVLDGEFYVVGSGRRSEFLQC